MRVIYNGDTGSANPIINKKTAVALGNFDGLHIGHMILIDKIKEYADSSPATRASCVWTFAEHSSNILNSDYSTPYITAQEEKAELLGRRNIDYLIFQDFNFVRHFGPDEFIDRVVADHLKAELAVCGYNYTFGRGREGGAELLRERLAKKKYRNNHSSAGCLRRARGFVFFFADAY